MEHLDSLDEDQWELIRRFANYAEESPSAPAADWSVEPVDDRPLHLLLLLAGERPGIDFSTTIRYGWGLSPRILLRSRLSRLPFVEDSVVAPSSPQEFIDRDLTFKVLDGLNLGYQYEFDENLMYVETEDGLEGRSLPKHRALICHVARDANRCNLLVGDDDNRRETGEFLGFPEDAIDAFCEGETASIDDFIDTADADGEAAIEEVFADLALVGYTPAATVEAIEEARKTGRRRERLLQEIADEYGVPEVEELLRDVKSESVTSGLAAFERTKNPN